MNPNLTKILVCIIVYVAFIVVFGIYAVRRSKKQRLKDSIGRESDYSTKSKHRDKAEVTAPRENRKDLGEDMELVSIHSLPRYLIDKRRNKRIEFMNETGHFCTVRTDDIDWDSLSSLGEECISRARNLYAPFPTRLNAFHNGVCKVQWQLNPDGRYFMDEDGFGMTDDVEVNIYGFIDREGKVVSMFRYINDNCEIIDQMRSEAEATVKANGESK